MSIDIQSLKAAMGRYFTHLTDKLGEKVPLVDTVLNALSLGDKTLQQLVQEADSMVADHVATTSGNPHDVTAEQVGSYRTSGLEAILGSHASSGLVPIDRYGSLDSSLPVIQGSFQGVGSYRGNGRAHPMTLEDDGTLRFLRVGTDCNTIGVYHGYLRNALSEAGLPDNTQRTPRRYRPSFFPAGVEANGLYFSDQNVIAGTLTNGDRFVSITGQTLDESTHIGCLIRDEDFPELAGAIAHYETTEVIWGPDGIYFILNNSYASATPSNDLRIGIWHLPTEKVLAGGYQQPERLDGWTTTTFYSAVLERDEVVVAESYASSSLLDRPLFFHDGTLNATPRWWTNSGSMNTTSAFHPESGLLRIRCAGESYISSSTSSQRGAVGFSFVLNVAERTAVLDTEFQNGPLDPPYYGYQDSAGVVHAQGIISQIHWDQFFAKVGTSNYSPSVLIAKSGHIFVIASYATSVLSRVEQLSRATIVGFTSAFDYLKPATGSLADSSVRQINFQFGSPVGSSVVALTRLDDEYALLFARGNNTRGEVMMAPIHARLGSPNHRYYSVFLGVDRLGRAPTAYRRFIEEMDTDFQPIDMAHLVNEWDGTQYHTHAQFFTAQNLSGFRSLSPQLVKSGSMSIGAGVLRGAIDEAVTLMAAGSELQLDTTLSEGCLVVPASDCPPLLIVAAIVPNDNVGTAGVYRAEVTMSGDEITAVTLGALVGTENFRSTFAAATIRVDSPATRVARSSGSFCIYRSTDGWVIAGQTPMTTMQTTNVNAVSLAIKGYVADSGNASTLGFYQDSASADNPGYACIDAELGVSHGISGSDAVDHNFRLIHRPFTDTTEATWRGGTPSTVVADSRVMIGQDLPEGFVVYFGEDTPVIINGQAATLPIRSIDLSEVVPDPANRTFYLYVEQRSGSVDYHIYTSYQSETITRLYIGVIITDGTGVYEISVEKTTRLAGYRISTTPRGSSIPATVGFPSQPAHLDPDWIP